MSFVFFSNRVWWYCEPRRSSIESRSERRGNVELGGRLQLMLSRFQSCSSKASLIEWLLVYIRTIKPWLSTILTHGQHQCVLHNHRSISQIVWAIVPLLRPRIFNSSVSISIQPPWIKIYTAASMKITVTASFWVLFIWSRRTYISKSVADLGSRVRSICSNSYIPE